MFDARDQAKLTFVAVILCCASTVAAAEHPFVANLRAKGLDPAKLSFVFETAERGLLGDYYGGLHASYNGQFVGSLNMHYDRESARCRSIHPIIELDIRRKGLGSVMYLLAAELAFAHDQSVLGYDKTQCLTGAVKVWGKLKKLGYATSGKRFIVGRLAAEPTLLTAQLQRQLSQTSLTRENFFGVQPRYAPLFERFRTQSPEAFAAARESGLLRKVQFADPSDVAYELDLTQILRGDRQLLTIHRQVLKSAKDPALLRRHHDVYRRLLRKR